MCRITKSTHSDDFPTRDVKCYVSFFKLNMAKENKNFQFLKSLKLSNIRLCDIRSNKVRFLKRQIFPFFLG